jgi:hypothetical protein
VIRREHRADVAELARAHEDALVAVGREVAEAVHALIPGCTAAVVLADTGPEWRMLAQCGPGDLTRSWRRLVAGTARITHMPGGPHDALVTPLRSSRINVMLVAVPEGGSSLPPSAQQIVRPLLDAGGILLDAALADDLEWMRAARAAGQEPSAARAQARWFGVPRGAGC